MTFDRIRLAMVTIAIGAVLAAAGCSSLKVNVLRDATVAIPPGSTWAWGPEPSEKKPEELDPRVNNSVIHGRIKQAVEGVLEQKGYRRIDDPALADFLVAYRVGVKNSRQVVTQSVPAAPMYWAGWGWGYYGPPPLAISREVTYSEGALMIDITQRSTGKLAFRATGLDRDVTGADASEEEIQKTVTKLLQALP